MEDHYKNGNNPMDDMLSKGLGDYAQAPGDEAWAAINAGRKAGIASSNRRFLILRWAAILLLFCSAVLAAMYWRPIQHEPEEYSSSQDGIQHSKSPLKQPTSKDSTELVLESTPLPYQDESDPGKGVESFNGTNDPRPHQAPEKPGIPTRDRYIKPTRETEDAQEDLSEIAINMDIPNVQPIEPKWKSVSFPKWFAPMSSTTESFLAPHKRTFHTYAGFSYQDARLGKVNYQKLPPPDAHQPDHELYNERLVHSSRNTMGVSMGVQLANGLILETGVYQSTSTVTQIHTGRFDPKNIQKLDDKHEYDAQIRTAGGYRDCQVKLKPKQPSHNPPKPFDVALEKEETFNSIDIPLNLGYGLQYDRWMFSARAGADLSLIKQKDLSLTVSEVNSEDYDLSLSDIELSAPISASFKSVWGMHGWVSAEYRPASYLGVQASLGSSLEWRKSTSNQPQRSWRAAEIIVKWYL